MLYAQVNEIPITDLQKKVLKQYVVKLKKKFPIHKFLGTIALYLKINQFVFP